MTKKKKSSQIGNELLPSIIRIVSDKDLKEEVVLNYINEVHDFFMWIHTYFENSVAWEIWPTNPFYDRKAKNINHFWMKWISAQVDKNPIIFWNALDPKNKMKLYNHYLNNKEEK